MTETGGLSLLVRTISRPFCVFTYFYVCSPLPFWVALHGQVNCPKGSPSNSEPPGGIEESLQDIENKQICVSSDLPSPRNSLGIPIKTESARSTDWLTSSNGQYYWHWSNPA